ncbi:uncharacterized protein N7496_006797 [Penicillium cataractarum]|uniref:SUN domain-containing protein n=1 Tax=Penicillium cataractarum TaxID=2100454 RepID=A0A9W9V8V4_9EURO|nr:uncharacterized protein N7496_006797 [Penicillium cataractarum]KAJ5370705.1 hypothetical protein N7496_006797 [Penicillium cataractarum]
MATKRTRRRQKGYATESEDEEAVETLLDFMPGPTLPAVPIANSWNYGATTGTGLPRKMALQPALDANRVAKRINAGLDMAEKRSASPPSRRITHSNLEPIGTRIRKTAAKNGGPVPRQPTPDQTQLMHTLQDATNSPPGSDATLSPPVAQTVSTDSSPPVDPPLLRRLSDSTNEPLYPSPLKRRGNHNTDAIVRSSPDRQSSVDNASEVSWSLERDIHEDDLQRTRPSKYRGEPHGQNITKPPRRPSGLSMIQDTILEEDEEQSELLSQPAKRIDTVREPANPRLSEEWEAPVRTIIPQEYESRAVSGSSPRRDSLAQQIWSSMSSQQSGTRTNKLFTSPRRSKWLRALLILLIPLGLFYAFQYQDEILQIFPGDNLARIRWSLPFGRSPIDFSSNMTDSAAFHGLQKKVTNMDSQFSSLSRELGSIRSELAQSPRTTSIVNPGRPDKPVPKINFLSPGMGAVVSPKKTSPSAGRKLDWIQKFYQYIPFFRSEYGSRTPPPPVTALEPWSDVGDCWCGTHDGVSQLAVILQHPIVPEEFVVENIPFAATPNPYTAPKDIEVWAHYAVFPSSDQKVDEISESSFTWSDVNPWKGETPEGNELGYVEKASVVTEETLPLVVMSTLRIANKDIPEDEYSGDANLGPNFYRIGKMMYDLYAEDYIQHFSFESTIEIPNLRVDQVVFRMTSNWGSNQTCIYRFKLHGHV